MSDENKEARVLLYEKIEALEKYSKKVAEETLDNYELLEGQAKQIEALKKKFEAFKEGEDDDIKEIGILREELAELKEKLDSRGEKELPNRENGLNHSYGINGEPNVHHSKLPEPKWIENDLKLQCPKCGWVSEAFKVFEPKTEPENPDDREFIHFDEKLWISLSKHAQKQKELIEEFLNKINDWLETEDEDGIAFVISLRDWLKGRIK